MSIGKQKRLNKIIRKDSKRAIIVPLDHGVTIGAEEGIENIKDVADDIADCVDALLMHKGLVRYSGLCEEHSDTALIVHLSASSILTPNVNTKRIVGSVEEAIRLGADGISIHVNIGDENEGQMLYDAGMMAEECNKWGLPLLMMLYGRGPKIINGFDPKVVGHCARIGAELGADIVKVCYTGDIESFSRVVNACPVPVVIAGGDLINDSKDLLRMVYNSLKAGGSGLSIGRNVFQHPDRRLLCKALRDIVHHNKELDEVLAQYNLDTKDLKAKVHNIA